jgi:uncharacterized lipoprotein YajG
MRAAKSGGTPTAKTFRDKTMTVTLSRYRLTISAVLLAGTAVLAGCATAPVTTTTSSQQTTTSVPRPPVMTTTTIATADAQQPVHIARVHHRHARYAMHHPRARSKSSDTETTSETTMTPMVTTSTTLKKTTTDIR